MESTISAIIGVTKYADAPGVAGTTRGLTPQIGPVMRPHDTANRVVRIPLHSKKNPGLYAIVDEADAELVNQYRWYPRLIGNTIYATTTWKIGGRSKSTQMHRLILGLAVGAGGMVDHRNRNGLDNRRANLRKTGAGGNVRNSGKLQTRSTTSKYKGVSKKDGDSRWVAGISANGKPYHIGRFDSEMQAAEAYDAAAVDLFGEYAGLNFPDQDIQPDAAKRWAYAKSKAFKTSRFRGVSKNVNGDKWRARIKLNGRTVPLGSYSSEEEAARVYDQAARELIGENAKLNFPKEGGAS